MLRQVLAPRRQTTNQSEVEGSPGRRPTKHNMLGTGKENILEEISFPTNVRRELHVSYDGETGAYRGLSEVLKVTQGSLQPQYSSDSEALPAAPKTPTPTKRNPRLKRQFNKFLVKRSPVIGSPLQLQHTVHVKVDPASTFGFSGLPSQWESMLERSGINRQEALENPRDLIDVLNYTRGSFPRILYDDDEVSAVQNDDGREKVNRSLLFLAEHQSGDFIEEDPYKAFKDMKKVGEGYTGSVFRAVDPLGRDVAVKRIRVDTEEDLDTVRSEVQLMRSIIDDRLVRCFGAYLWEDVAWISMEYINGGSLAQLLKDFNDGNRGNLDEEYIAYIMRAILEALDALHSRRYVHRDVKSDNTLVSLNGCVKLGDFGFCAELSDTRSKRNSVVGTPCWMAPEVIGGECYDTKADVWSAGILALESAEGRPPYQNEGAIRAMFLIKTQGPRQLSNPDAWSNSFKDFLNRSMAKDAEQRATARQLLRHPFLEKACSRADFADLVQFVLQERNFRRLESAPEFSSQGASELSELQ
eukprot:Plantae.Rhodophyta-Purpureofilum_apyrenoidigerum.ctg3003.p1 GENE.Plantae.Rhodophyta-Purpureofilum_apyrenoidigerum.ctg3003~~Plantae.Rhodophyta-Purpureofilum_apyrenoidigerum.ctg3003.p1  ORF type:complete len:527 (-),score=85.61 Plantae.Rhodophyta-Purpureofilum_apyrenoidigerum.ctg3003:383-1963(-)